VAAWTRRSNESKEAYAAFQYYLREGSIDAAYVASTGHPLGDGKRAARRWAQWSADYEWVARAAQYADHLAEQNRHLWEQRRRDLQERDWAQADALRAVVDAAIPGAQQFIRRKVAVVKGETIVTLAFDIVGLTLVLEKASKLQRLATDEPTDHLKLSGAALDGAIERIALGLAGLADGSEAQTPSAAATDESAGDGAPDRADTSSTGGDEAM
jgi:hypothetical protein